MVNVVELTEYEFQNERSELRNEIVKIFLKEEPGMGNGDKTSKYYYIVKRIDGFVVYLERPAHLNKGFDFTVNVKGIVFYNSAGKASTKPSHQNIIDDLVAKKMENPKLFGVFKKQIDNIYSCQPPIKDDFPFTTGIDSKILLECIKWFFIEQDITYWNYSGRAMLYKAILDSI